MYRDRLWTMRQYAGYTSAIESNKRYHYLLNSGVMGLSVAFDLPTQIGYDSDHAMAEGEVGKVGVPISHISDMDTLFKDIPLNNELERSFKCIAKKIRPSEDEVNSNPRARSAIMRAFQKIWLIIKW